MIEADHAGRRMRPSGAGRQDRYLGSPSPFGRSRTRAAQPKRSVPSPPFESHDELALTRFGHLDGEREHLGGRVEAECREHGDIKLRRLLQPIRKSMRLA